MNKSKCYKVIVAHPHKQHSFQLAAALEKRGVLFRYVTTVYNKERSITSIITSHLQGKEKQKAESRYCEDIPDDKVVQICELSGLFYLLVMRLTHNNKRIMDPLDRYISNKFGKKLAKLVIKEGVDCVICYDTQSTELFKQLKKQKSPCVRVLDVSAANLLYLKEIYQKDMEILPEFKKRLINERPSLFSKGSKKAEKLVFDEIMLSNYFLVPSDFVSQSLLFSGVNIDAIFKCPYGLDLTNFQQKKYPEKTEYPIRFIYVGGLKQLKGVGYLLKVFSEIDPSMATLTIVGAGNIDDEDLRKYKNSVNFMGMVLHTEIAEVLAHHDVFVFPSLGDSYGFAPLEAAAVGLPLILSENTGLADYVENSVNGFIIPTHSEEALKSKIEWFIKNRELIRPMGESAHKMALSMSMNRYYNAIDNFITSIMK